MSYRLLLLGRPALVRGSETIALRSSKGQALLWYLAAHPDESFARKRLHGLLWDGVPADAARRDFNTMLFRFRAELQVPWVHGTRGRLQWNPEVGVSIDATEFLNLTEPVVLAEQATSTRRSDDVRQAHREALYSAVALWNGPFLDGFSCDSEAYEEWMRAERLRWDSRILQVLGALVQLETEENRWEYVVEVARRALQIDPIHEPFHRAVMQALYRQGNRAAALAQYELFGASLLEQLGAEPDATTTALFETIRAPAAGALVGTGTPTGTSAPSTTDTVPPSPAPSVLLPANIGLFTQGAHPLVGRAREYERAKKALLDVTIGGRGHIVLLYGEAGIGKTRLLTELMAAASAGRLEGTCYGTVLAGRAYETMLGVPYAVFIEALDAILPAARLSTDLPDSWLRELGRLLPDVFVHRPDLSAPEPMVSGDDRLRLFQAVSRLLRALPQPVLLALEDLQWADAFSLAMLAYLIRLAPSGPGLAVVATVRAGDEPDETNLILRTLERERLLTRIELANLTEEDTVTLVEALFPEGGPQRGTHVYSQSQGHPLHTVELTSMLRESADTTSESAPLPIPPTVQDVFIGRLVRLGHVAMVLADALAVFPHGATAWQLCRVAELPEAEAVSGLNDLIRARIVTENDDGTIVFKHDLFRQVILERLSRTHRSYTHRRAYATLSESLPEVVSLPATTQSSALGRQLPADLIVHSVGGQLWEDAVRWTGQAADVAEKLYAFPTAARHLETMLECLAKLPDTAERREQSLDVELRISKLDYWSAPDKRDARLAAITKRALAYGATSHLPLIQLAQAESYMFQGRLTAASDILKTLAPLATQDPRLRIRLIAWQAAICSIVGDVKQALVHFERVRQATKGQVLKPGTSVYAGLAVGHASLGEFDEAEAAMAAMELEEKEQGYPGLTSKFLTVAATVAYIRGEWREAAEKARRGIDTSRAAEDPYNEALSALWLGAAFVELGKAEDAVQALESALEASERAQTYTRRDFIYAYLASAYLQAGQYEQADAAVTAGLHLAEQFGYKEGHALCKEVQGRIAAARGNLPLARECLANALKCFESLSIAAGIARSRKQLAALDRVPRDLKREAQRKS